MILAINLSVEATLHSLDLVEGAPLERNGSLSEIVCSLLLLSEIDHVRERRELTLLLEVTSWCDAIGVLSDVREV
jgi:hypothetical protein